MDEVYSCTFATCDKVFSKAYELRKHKATHDNPDSVFYCSECHFITLQKKNLVIHFATGDKIHEYPDMINFDGYPRSSVREELCEYRTNDPAALSRHRKKAHGYVPPPNRARIAKVALAAPSMPRHKKDEKVSQICPRFQRLVPVSCRRLPHVARKTNIFRGGPEYTRTSARPPMNPDPVFCQASMSGDAVGADCYDKFDYSPGSATLVGSDEEMGLVIPCDSSLRSQWVAEYEEGYSTLNMTGMRHLLEPLRAVPPLALASLDMQTGLEGCLRPEWMVEAGVEGWD